MAVLKLDPPPNTNNIEELRAYVNDLYEAVCSVIYNLDSDNMSEDFLGTLNFNNNEGDI